jgi:peptidoglycan-associated lipoprotein
MVQLQNKRREKMRKNVWWAFVLIMTLSVMFFTISCAQKVVQTQPVSTMQPEVPTASDKSSAEPEQAGQMQEDRLQVNAAALEAAETAFVNDHIFFAFDSALLTDQSRQILNEKADYLRTHSGVTVTVEGHCDDRGTDAYNIALGDRRAQSVKKFLVDLGVSTNRLNTVSYGEERPIAMGQNEASWAKNRRAQFVIN